MIEVKFTFEDEEGDEAARCSKYVNAYCALSDMRETIRRWIKYENLSQVDTEKVQQDFYAILEMYGLDDV